MIVVISYHTYYFGLLVCRFGAYRIKGTNEGNKVSKGAKIRNRYIQVPHLTQDTKGKMINSEFDTTNYSKEVSPFPAGDHKAHINRRAQRHSKHKTEKNIKDPQKNYCLGMVSKNFTGGLKRV